MNLIFGSTALVHWYPDFTRVPSDLDYIGKARGSRKVEYHWVPGFQYILDHNKDSTYVDPDFLYTIKISHAAWDVRWDKTMHDINFLKQKGCKLDMELYSLLLKDWEKQHHAKRIVLNGSPDEFFNKNVTRKVDHDKLHEMVMFYDRPMHERIRPDPNNVKCSKKLWDALSHEDKLKCAWEEAFVFALERYNEFPPTIALNKALKHLITKSTKGYFNLFLIDNYFDLRYNSRDTFISLYTKIRNEYYDK